MSNSPSNGDRSLTGVLVEKLLRDIRALTDRSLPPMPVLCRRYGVSAPTLSKAVHRLADQGVLLVSRGRRIELVRPDEADLVPFPSALERTQRSIGDRILKGIYRAGKPLPKMARMAADIGTSNTTVIRAMAHLASRGLVTKRGRQWIVGSCGQAAPRRRSHGPAILILQEAERVWSGLLAVRTRRFVETFSEDAQAFGVRLAPCVLPATQDPTPLFTRGPDNILKLARSLGSRYLGAIAVGRRVAIAEYRRLFRELVGKRRPLLWLNTEDDGTLWEDGEEAVTTCALSEQAFSGAGLDALASAGHRCIGYVGGYTGNDWKVQRYRAMSHLGARATPAVRVFSRHDVRGILWQTGRDRLLVRLREIEARGPDCARRLLRYLLEQAGYDGRRRTDSAMRAAAHLVFDHLELAGEPEGLGSPWEILPFLLLPEVTALAVSRDYHAQSILRALTAVGWAVPADISLISFDNYLDASVLPVTTVDNGMGMLGYRAFHAILADVPVPGAGEGRIFAKPAVVDRGTVSAPPQWRLPRTGRIF